MVIGDQIFTRKCTDSVAEAVAEVTEVVLKHTLGEAFAAKMIADKNEAPTNAASSSANLLAFDPLYGAIKKATTTCDVLTGSKRASLGVFAISKDFLYNMEKAREIKTAAASVKALPKATGLPEPPKAKRTRTGQ